jgi:hypothetical protein
MNAKQTQHTVITLSNHHGRKLSTLAFYSTHRETICRAAASLLACCFDMPYTEARFTLGGQRYAMTQAKVLAAKANDFAGIDHWADLADEIA